MEVWGTRKRSVTQQRVRVVQRGKEHGEEISNTTESGCGLEVREHGGRRDRKHMHSYRVHTCTLIECM